MPLLTLTTDIGNQDYLVGAIKGQILQVNDSFQLVDISHGLIPFNYNHAAYVCRNAIRHFPDDTFHLVVNNLFHTPPQRMILARLGTQYMGMADNGLITMIAEGMPDEWIFLPLTPGQPVNTLTCCRLIAEAFSGLLAGKTLGQLGERKGEPQTKLPLRPQLGENYMEGQIIFIDHFENVIINITRDEFDAHRKGRPFQIIFKRDEVIKQISESYADVPVGEKLALFNAAGYLELAINKGNAAGLFGLQGFTEKAGTQTQYIQRRLYYQTIRILFE